MLQDLRYAMRNLLRQPSFTLVAVAALALGIGANATVFSVVNAVLLRPLPYDEPARLVRVWDRVQRLGFDRGNVSPPNFIDWQRQSQSFESLEAYTESFLNLAVDGDAVERIYGLEVTPRFFDTLGVRPILGRCLRPEDVSSGAARAAAPAVISHGLWQRRFGSDPTIVGRFITLNGSRAEVVGVLPSAFLVPGRRFDVFRPLAFTRDQIENGRGRRWLTVVGRLTTGVGVEQAQAEMDMVTARLAEQYPDVNQGRGATVRSLEDEVFGAFRSALVLLQGAVAFVLLIAASNVANLQVARSLSRRREMAVRTAVGATRWRLVRQLLAESLVLAMMGAALGMVIASGCTRLVVAFGPADIPRIEGVGFDGPALAFTVLVAAFVSILFGLPLALEASKADVHSVLKEGCKASAGTGRHRFQGALVIAEVALSLVLLVAAGLLIKSLVRLQNVDVGFVAGEAVAMDISLGSGYRDGLAHARLFEDLIERVEGLPGVRSAGVTKDFPLSGESSRRSFSLVGDSSALSGATLDAECRRVSAHFLDSMGISLVSGRGLVGTDTEEAPGVVLVNAAFARRFLPDQDPLGKQLVIQDGPPRQRQIIGVVQDVKHFGLDVAAVPEMYVPHVDRPWPSMTLVVRVKGVHPRMIVPGVRRELAALDKALPLANVRTIDEDVAASTAQQRFSMRLLGTFAALALLLTVLGVYGVMAYSVAQRTRELGIRIALGAENRDILRLILGDGLRLVSIGVVIGLAGAFAMGQMMTRVLFDVSAHDPVVLVCVAALLAGVALLACYLPARRASQLDPAVCVRL